MMKTTRRPWGRLAAALALLALLGFGLAGSAAAAEFRSGDTVVIAANEVIEDDLFLSGGRVEMHGTVRGDLFATGGQVIVDGRVDGSVFAAGQSVEVNAPVRGSLYTGGYSLTLGSGANVTRNVYFGGFSLRADRQSSVGRSVYVGGYQAILDGTVSRDVSIGGAALELNGTVGGDVEGEVRSSENSSAPPFMPFFPGSVAVISPGFHMGDQASVAGNVNVTETTRDGQEGSGRNIVFGLARWLADRVGEFIALLIVGALLMYIWPAVFRSAGERVQGEPVPSAGWGCLVTLVFFVGVPLAALLIVMVAIVSGVVTFGQLFGDVLSLGGASLALIVVAFGFIASLVTKAVVAALGGRLILERASPQTLEGRWGGILALALGALIYEVLRAIPLLGALVALVVILVGLGAIALVLRDRMRPEAAAA